jgi:hypothetical protein
MTRLPEGRREVYPSKARRPKRRAAPDFGPGLNVSVPISFGLPLVVIGIALIAGALAAGSAVFWITGGIATVAGMVLFASGKRL